MKKSMRFFLLASLVLLPVASFAAEPFVALTNIPGLTDAGNSPDLPAFLNNLYKIAIGLAAVLAVLQIIRGGITYMLGDSLMEKKEARALISMSIFGLILVLSPVIVFSLINRDILELDLDVKSLAPNRATDSTITIEFTTAAECKAKGGTVGGTALNPTCSVPTNSKYADEGGLCGNFKSPQKQSTDEKCSDLREGGVEYQKVSNSCCSAVGTGEQCCALAKTSTAVDVSRSITALMYYSPEAYKDWNPTPSNKVGYEKYASACTSSGGTIKKVPQGDSASDCTGSDKAAAPSSSDGKCQVVRVSCDLP